MKTGKKMTIEDIASELLNELVELWHEPLKDFKGLKGFRLHSSQSKKVSKTKSVTF